MYNLHRACLGFYSWVSLYVVIGQNNKIQLLQSLELWIGKVIDLQRDKVMKSHCWLFQVQGEWCHKCGGNDELFYQETDLSQISLVTSSKTVKVSEPSFLYILSNTACGISRIHTNTNNLLFHKPSSSKIYVQSQCFWKSISLSSFYCVWDVASG